MKKISAATLFTALLVSCGGGGGGGSSSPAPAPAPSPPPPPPSAPNLVATPVAETRADRATQNYGVTGRGVAVAILDRGIDWSHAAFRNPDGTTRIAYIFDLVDDSGASSPGNSYGMGTIYTRAQINAALSGAPALATRDAVGHGTSTTGLCCGNGAGSPNGVYRGIAPDSTLIIIKYVSDGAPAHDGETAEAPFYRPERASVAIDFARDKAAELGIPLVMLLNIGSVGGPSDGTSTLAHKIDATVGSGKPGIVFVTGTGDDGGSRCRARGQVTPAADGVLRIQKVDAAVADVDVWYAGTDRFGVTMQTPVQAYGPYPPPASSTDTGYVTTPEFDFYHYGEAQRAWALHRHSQWHPGLVRCLRRLGESGIAFHSDEHDQRRDHLGRCERLQQPHADRLCIQQQLDRYGWRVSCCHQPGIAAEHLAWKQ
jgi:subtilisin family serine protease